MIKCHKCGKNMSWQNDWDYSDVYGDELEGIISIWECIPCNISYEITEIFEKDVDDVM